MVDGDGVRVDGEVEQQQSALLAGRQDEIAVQVLLRIPVHHRAVIGNKVDLHIRLLRVHEQQNRLGVFLPVEDLVRHRMQAVALRLPCDVVHGKAGVLSPRNDAEQLAVPRTEDPLRGDGQHDRHLRRQVKAVFQHPVVSPFSR